VSGGTEHALKKEKEGWKRRGKSVTDKNTGSIFALIIPHLEAVYFQIFLTSYFYTVETGSGDGMRRLRNSS